MRTASPDLAVTAASLAWRASIGNDLLFEALDVVDEMAFWTIDRCSLVFVHRKSSLQYFPNTSASSWGA